MILINALSALDGGGQTYLVNLLENLPTSLKHQIVILAGSTNQLIFKRFGVRVIVSHGASKSIIHRLVFENWQLKKLIKTENIRVYFSLSGILPVGTGKLCKTVVVFQNLLPFIKAEAKKYPLGYIRLRHILLFYAQLKALRNSDFNIFISHYSKSIIEQFVKTYSAGSIVIHHGLDKRFLLNNGESTRAKFNFEYVLYVSKLHPYKAHLEVLQSWIKLRERRETQEKLVFVGEGLPGYERKIRHFIKVNGLENEVLMIGKISYHELPSIYRQAKLNVFASSCESFGIILLEKMASKRPVICADCEPYPEIAGDSVTYFDLADANTLTDQFMKYLDNEEEMSSLGERGYRQATKYRWKDSAEKTWGVLAGFL